MRGLPGSTGVVGRPEALIEVATEQGSITDEGWRVRKDGSRFWGEVTISAGFDDAGTLRGFGTVTSESSEPMAAQ